LLAGAVSGGTLATYLLDDDHPLAWRACLGAALGLALFGLAGFVLASWRGLTPSVTLAAGLVAALPLGLLGRADVRRRLRADTARLRASLPSAFARPSPRVLAAAAFFTAALFVALRVSDRAVFERNGGLYVGVDHNLGDLPFHAAVINGFTRGLNFPPEHPELAGAPLTYPFVADFVSALLVRAGLPLRDALFLPTAVLAVALLGMVYGFARRLAGDVPSALLGTALFFLNGGLGFALLFREADPRAGGLAALLARLPHDYTILFSGGLRWGNVVTTLFVPQRSILLGFPLAVAACSLLFDGRRGGRGRWVAAGVLAGVLPLVHAHSLAVVAGVAAVTALTFRRPREVGWLLLVAGVLAAPQLAWLARGTAVQAQSFLGWQLGFDRGRLSPPLFWLLNAGLSIPLLLAALFWPRIDADARRFYLPFGLLFVLANVLRLSPWIWDNMKFLVFWHVGSAPLVAALIVRLAGRARGRRWAAAAAVVVLTLSGALDLWRVVSRAVAQPVFDAQMVGFADAVAARTPARSLMVHAPRYNSALALSGRRSLLGYPGHIWSQGMSAGSREDEVRAFYGGGEGARRVAARYGIDYALLGPQERELLTVDDAFFASLPVVVEHGPYRLHAVPAGGP
jgi:hypothetical protein